MKKYGQFLKELPSRKLVIVALDFQPITKNHEKLLAVATKVAASQSAVLMVLILSNSKKKKIQPLTFLPKLFPKATFLEVTSVPSTITTLVKNGKYDDVTYVTSAEAEKEAATLTNKLKTMVYVLKGIAQDPDSSAESKAMIDAAKKGDLDTFRRFCPSLMIELEVKRMFNNLRQSYGIEAIKEQVKFEVPEIREKYFNGEIFNIDEIVECANSGEVYKIVKRGSNHLLVQNESGSLISKWLQDVVQSSKHFGLQEGKEMKFSQTDKIKVARVIASSLGVEDVEKSNNPELLINTALRKAKSKAMKPEYMQVVHSMLKTAKEAGIAYDEKLVASQVEEAVGPDNTPETDPPATDIKQPSIAKVGHTLEAEKDHLRKMKIKHHLGEEKEEDEEMSEEDIEKMINGLKDDDYLDAYDDEELHIIDADTGEHIAHLKEETEAIMEVLSRAERIRAKVRFARSESKREHRTQIALKTRSNSQTLNKRARRLAVQLMKQRLAKKPVDKLSIGEKERIEAIIERRKAIIGRIAMKLVPKIRKIETDRLTHRNFTK